MKNRKKLRWYTMIFACIALTTIITFSAEQSTVKIEKTMVPEKIKTDYKPIVYEPDVVQEEQTPTEDIKPQEEYVFGFEYPVNGEIIYSFSNGELVYSMSMNDYRVHNGVDISGELLQRVCAAERGTVEKVYEDLLMGKTIIIDHHNGYKTVYSNLSSTELVNMGDEVEKGDVISGIGDTAITEQSVSPHVHFEIINEGKNVNPEEIIK